MYWTNCVKKDTKIFLKKYCENNDNIEKKTQHSHEVKLLKNAKLIQKKTHNRKHQQLDVCSFCLKI